MSIRILLPIVTLVTTFSLLILLAFYAQSALALKAVSQRIPMLVEASNNLFSAIQDVRLERGNVNRALSAPGITGEDTLRDISNLRKRSANSLKLAIEKIGNASDEGIQEKYRQIENVQQALIPVRNEVDASLRQPRELRPKGALEDWDAVNEKLVTAIDDLSSQLDEELSQVDAFVAQMIEIKRAVWPIRSDSGDDRRLILLLRTAGRPATQAEKRELDLYSGRMSSVWRLVQDAAERPSTPEKLRDLIKSADRKFFTEYRAMRDRIADGLVAGKAVAVNDKEWLRLSDESRDSIYQIARMAYSLASDHAYDQLRTSQAEFQRSLLLIFAFALAGAVTIVYVLRGVVRPIRHIADTMKVVAAGDLTHEIPYEARSDEIGVLARALRFFQEKVAENQKLYTAKIVADDANRSKSEFLASMSHELRTPLNAILGYSEIIKDAMFGPVSERYRSYSSDIHKSGTHLLALINDILDLSKLEAKQFKLHEEKIDVHEIVKSCMSFIRPQATKGAIRLYEDIPATLPRILADEVRLKQILLNLLSNAAKFTPKGGQISISACEEHGSLKLTVSDTGIGIPKDQLQRVLEPFHQVDSKVSRKHHGTGLGLALTKGLVEKHGGTLAIESELNRGTSVTLTFPPERTQRETARAMATVA